MVEYSWWDREISQLFCTKPKQESTHAYSNATTIILRLDQSRLDTLALVLWYGVCVMLSPLSWQKRPLLTMGYFIVGWTIWFGLTELDPVFLFVLAGLYPQVFILPPLPGKILGAFLLTALSAWQQVMLAGGIDWNLFLMLAVAVSGIIMALFIYAIVEQSQQRQHLILIADDHPVVRAGLQGMLASQPDFELVGEATTGMEAAALAAQLRPDVVLMDLRMAELDGAAATA
jgi:Response regulator receiver domain